MTTLPIEFQIDNAKGTIRLYGLTQALTPNSLASNISFVQWDGVTNTGRIYYNDRIGIPESFPDPSPYQTYINSWMSSAAAGAVPLTLAQAQAVKAGLIDSIWAVKRQAPLAVSTSLGSFTFDCNDVNSASISISNVLAFSKAINSAIVTVVAALNTAITNHVTSINSVTSSVVSQVDTAFTNIATNINSSGGAVATECETDFNIVASGGSITAIGGTNVTWTAVPNYGTIAPGSSTYSGPGYSSPGALTMGIDFLPIGSTSYPVFTLSDMVAIFNALEAQRSNELLVRAGKQAALAALSTVAAVVAYDATTGW